MTAARNPSDPAPVRPGLRKNAQDGLAIKLGAKLFFFEILVSHDVNLNDSWITKFVRIS